MKMRKTWLSYPLWLLLTAVSGILLAACTATVCINYFNVSRYVTVIFICLSFVLASGIWTAGRKGISYLVSRCPADEHFYNMWECFFALSLLSAFVLYRIYFLINGFYEPVRANWFYEMAMIKDGGGIPNILHGASYLYTLLLSFVFSFMGNKIFAGICLQFILQLMAGVFLYFGVRLIAGRIAALTAVAVAAFSPVYMKNLSALSPEGLYIFLFAAALFLAGMYLRGISKNRFRNNGFFVFFLLLGTYIGFMIYLDIIGITLLFLPFIALFVRNKERDKVPMQLLMILAGAIVGVVSTLAWDALYTGPPFSDTAAAFFGQYGNSMRLSAYQSVIMTEPVWGMGICFLTAFSVIGFFRNKNQKTDIWVIMLAFIAATNLSGIAKINYDIFEITIWAILAGTGISSMWKEKEPALQITEPMAVTEYAAKEKETDEEIEEIVMEPLPEKKITYIQNPLPLPKKHVKKDMDYDIEVEDNDDFDIK